MVGTDVLKNNIKSMKLKYVEKVGKLAYNLRFRNRKVAFVYFIFGNNNLLIYH